MTGISSEIKEIYWRAFRKKAHQLLAIGFCAVRCKIGPNDIEDDITGTIEEAINEFLDDSCDPLFIGFDVHGFPRQHGTGKRGKRRPEIDLTIKDNSNRPSSIFAFEAKRLRTSDHPIGAYVGPQGMGCFTSDIYAPEAPEAAMVGYIQNKDHAYWFSELSRTLTEEVVRFPVIPEIQNEWASQHERLTGSPVRILHIFLDCSLQDRT